MRTQQGDVIRVRQSTFYTSEGPDELYQVEGQSDDRHVHLIRHRDIYRGRSFFGPSSTYSQDQTEWLSTSGGPFFSVVIGENLIGLRAVGPIRRTFWRWRDHPRAGGGIEYERNVTLWEADTITKRI